MGIVLGTGLGGVAVGATQAVHAPIGIGLGAAMGLAVARALVGSLLAPLLDRTEVAAQVGVGEESDRPHPPGLTGRLRAYH